MKRWLPDTSIRSARKIRGFVVLSSVKESDGRAPNERLTVEQALVRGREQGLAEGRIEGRRLAEQIFAKKHLEVIESLIDAMTKLRQESRDSLEALEAPFTDLALKVAERIIALELDEGHYDLKAIAREALDTVGQAHDALKIIISPLDAEAFDTIRGESPFPPHISIDTDVKLSRGDVRIETEGGHLQADIQTRLETLKETLFDRAIKLPTEGETSLSACLDGSPV